MVCFICNGQLVNETDSPTIFIANYNAFNVRGLYWIFFTVTVIRGNIAAIFYDSFTSPIVMLMRIPFSVYPLGK
jgi:hypothetical protein